MTGVSSQELKALLAVLALLAVVLRYGWLRLVTRKAGAAPSAGEAPVVPAPLPAGEADAAAPAPTPAAPPPPPADPRARVERICTALFVALAVVAVGNYYGFSTKPLTDPKAFDGYDLMHYYLNAKYFDELGYTGLYDAIVIADSERKDRFRAWHFSGLRDLDTSTHKSIATVYARADEIKGWFTPHRWRDFKNDFRFLQRTMRRKSQERMLNDHGYNGPPLLQTLAGKITNAVPVESVKLLCHVETVLILLMFFVIWRTWGTRMTAITVLWFAISFSARWPGVGYGIFRIDWFISLVLAGCLLHGVDPAGDEPLSRSQRRRALGAGVLLAYSAMMKIFPLVWLFGLGSRALWLLATRRKLDRVAVPVFAAFLLTTAVLSAVTVKAVGMRNIREFAEDINEHLQPLNLSQQRMGFGIALSYRGEWRGGFHGLTEMRNKWLLVGELKTVRYGVGLLALLLLGFTIRPRDAEAKGARTVADDATMLGFLPFYFLMIASHYYWIHRLTVVQHHAQNADEEHPDHVIGLGLLFGIEAFTNYVDKLTNFRYVTTSLTSAALGVYCAWVIGTRLARTLRRERPVTSPAPDPVPGAMA